MQRTGPRSRAADEAARSDPTALRIPGPKSETKALLWSLLGTAVPVTASAPTAFGERDGSGKDAAAIVFVGSLVVCPSLGHFYAARSGRALKGMGIRALAFASLGAIVAATWDENSPAGEAASFISLGLGATAVAWDIVKAPESARLHNDEARRMRVTIRLGPSRGASGPGLRAEASF